VPYKALFVEILVTFWDSVGTPMIEIAVPALVSEALFLMVQKQLEENRKQARQRRRGAAHLLQGLVVCGHCHYAYYGKKISPSSAKGKKAYAY
jgi:site-specific DNA recombinase